jgi:hypothetical protein
VAILVICTIGKEIDIEPNVIVIVIMECAMSSAIEREKRMRENVNWSESWNVITKGENQLMANRN